MSGRTDDLQLLPFLATSGRIIDWTSAGQGGEVDVLEIDVHLAGLDLRQVEDVVDHAEQMPAGRLDLFEIAASALQALVLRPPPPGSRCSR